MRKKKSERTRLIEGIDQWVKEYQKKRAGYKCQRCKKEVKGKSCQWSHIIPKRGNEHLRWHLDNSLILCGGCHMKWHEDPLRSVIWFADTYTQKAAFLLSLSEPKKKNLNVKELKELFEKIKVNYI